MSFRGCEWHSIALESHVKKDQLEAQIFGTNSDSSFSLLEMLMIGKRDLNLLFSHFQRRNYGINACIILFCKCFLIISLLSLSLKFAHDYPSAVVSLLFVHV